MSDKLSTFPGGRGQKSTFTGLRLNTLENSRESFARVIRAYGKGDISENMGRALTYMLAQYLNYWKLEADLRVEQRLDAIESRLRDGEQ